VKSMQVGIGASINGPGTINVLNGISAGAGLSTSGEHGGAAALVSCQPGAPLRPRRPVRRHRGGDLDIGTPRAAAASRRSWSSTSPAAYESRPKAPPGPASLVLRSRAWRAGERPRVRAEHGEGGHSRPCRPFGGGAGVIGQAHLTVISVHAP
jgi:hypothetical protein